MPATAAAIRRWSRAFTAWRRHRPFWGGVLTITGAVELLALTAAPLQIMLIRGLAGIGTLVIVAMLISLAVISWTHVHLRVICGVFIVILGLASFAVSNMGGFFIGLLLTLVGGSLIYAWRPGEPTGTEGDATDAPETGDKSEDEAEASEPPPDAPPKPSLRPRPSAPEPESGTVSRLRLLPRLACVLVVVAAVFTAVPPASAQQAGSDEPTLPCPDWWPWCETEESTDPDDPDKPGGDDPDDPDKPGDDDPDGTGKPARECDESELPARPPKLGTEAAETVAKVLAACLALPGTSQPQDRDLPTASIVHPVLTAEVMTMSAMNSGGIVDVPTVRGTQPALEFTMDTLELTDMDQSSGIDGTDARLHVINMRSTAVLSGDVRLYVQRMKGLIFGVVPIILTADTPLPPIPVPYLVITQAEVDTVYTRADRVDLPHLEEPTR